MRPQQLILPKKIVKADHGNKTKRKLLRSCWVMKSWDDNSRGRGLRCRWGHDRNPTGHPKISHKRIEGPPLQPRNFSHTSKPIIPHNHLYKAKIKNDSHPRRRRAPPPSAFICETAKSKIKSLFFLSSSRFFSVLVEVFSLGLLMRTIKDLCSNLHNILK